MSWGRFGAYVPLYRASISLDGNGASADYAITVPADHPIWDTIDASGAEIRVTDADGQTVLTYQWSGFSLANRTGTIQIDNFTAGTGIEQVWLYWGMAGASSGAGSFVASAPRSGYIEMGEPGAVRIVPVAERPGATTPERVVTKLSSDSIWIWFDILPLLQRQAIPTGTDGNRHSNLEEIRLVSYEVYSGASAQAAMITATSPRIYGGRYIKVLVKAGSSGTDYTIRLTTTTTIPTQASGQTFARRVELKVYDVAE